VKYQSASITGSSSTRVHQCVVSAETCLRDVIARIDSRSESHILVENPSGQLIGIVELATLWQRLNVANPVERKRWEEMPVESVLQWKISPANSPTNESAAHSELPIHCTAVHGNDGVSAFVSDQDVFVSWQVVKQSLSEAMTDPVTSLPNRQIFERRLSEELSRASRDSHSLAVILFYIDHFKEVNDMYGHCVGDAALNEIANRLKEQLQSY
jgi:GGDEF domain-containing protein